MGRFREVVLAFVSALGCSQSQFTVGAPAEDASTDTRSGDTGADTGRPDTGGDTCVPNECGGCGPLGVKLGDVCGACGLYVCEKGAAKCLDPGKNECGGCAKLTAKVGDGCGGTACGSGTLACDGKNALKCSVPTNECGGCKPLVNKPGTDCNTCGKWACGTDRETTVCDEKLNVCGGCPVILDTLGSSCGSCGKRVCSDDKSKLTCAEATPAVDSACGLCGTSKNFCVSPAVTSCSKPDDRVIAVDMKYTDATDPVGVTSRMRSQGISYKTAKAGSVTKVVVKLKRVPYVCEASLATGVCASPDPLCKTCSIGTDAGCSCMVPAPAEGSVSAYVYKGVAGGTLTLLGYATIPASLIPTTLTDVSFALPTPAPSQPIGTDIFVWMYSWSEAHAFEIWGGASPPSSLTTAEQVRYPTAGSWNATKYTAAINVQILTCGT